MKVQETKKVKVNKPIGGYQKGDVVNVKVDSKGVPIKRYWRDRLKDAKIDGSINANGLIVEGYVHGNVQCTGKAELRPGARIKGDIACASLSVSRGCALEGKIEMLEGKLKTFVAQRNMIENELNI